MLSQSAIPEYHGSGTFVRLDGEPCLLTAAHVWDAMAAKGSVGLVTDPERAVRWAPMASLQLGLRLRGSQDEWGPDIALLKLHQRELGRLEEETKAFYDLDKGQASVAESEETWSIVGAPGEFLRMDAPDAAYFSNHNLGSKRAEALSS